MEEPENIDGPTFKNQDTEEEFKLNTKLLLESLRHAFVYTTRIDEMKVTKHQNNPEMLKEIFKQSKPIYKERRRINRNIFEKPLNMRYDLKKIQGNPDFNWKKKIDLIGYKNIRCLRDARRLCKPVTIDLCKTFEKFIDNNGRVNVQLEQNKQNKTVEQYSIDLSDSETISVYSGHTDVENVNPLGIQIVGTCSLSTEHKKEELEMKINFNFNQTRNSTPSRAILVMIDEKQNTQKMYDVELGSCYEIKSTYHAVSSYINIKYCCYCRRNLILQNLVKNSVLIPVTTLRYFPENILCSTSSCDCCCKFTVHANVICYFDKKKTDAVPKGNLESAVTHSMKKIDLEVLSKVLSKYKYRYVHKYIERGVLESEEMYVIFTYIKKYSNKYNPKHKYEVYHIDKLSRIKSHLTCMTAPVLHIDSPKYMFELCCWFKRIKIIYSLEVVLAKSLTYLRSMHNCSVNNCNCCCSALISTIPVHKEWDVKYFPTPSRSISSDIDVQRARWKPTKKYYLPEQRKNNQICSTLNFQPNSGNAESINSTNVQEATPPIDSMNSHESVTTSVANSNTDSGLDIENSLPAFVLATQAKNKDLPSSLEKKENNMDYDALSIFKEADLKLTPDGRITAVFPNLEQKLDQDQLISMCKVLNIAQRHVHLIDFNKDNAMEELIKIVSSKCNEINNRASVPIITDVFSLAESAPKSDNLRINVRSPASLLKNNTQPAVSQPNVIQPILYRAILGQANVSQYNASQPSVSQVNNVGQANVFLPITIPGNFVHPNNPSMQENNIQPNIIQQSNIVPNIIQQNNIVPNIIQRNDIQPNSIQQNNVQPNSIQQNNIVPNVIQQNNIPSNYIQSNIGTIILPDNIILVPNLVVAPNPNENIINTTSDNNQASKRQAVPLPTIDNSVKRFATENLVTHLPNVHSVVQGQQEIVLNESDQENEDESILGL